MCRRFCCFLLCSSGAQAQNMMGALLLVGNKGCSTFEAQQKSSSKCRAWFLNKFLFVQRAAKKVYKDYARRTNLGERQTLTLKKNGRKRFGESGD